MELRITGRHTKVPAAVREYAEQKLTPMVRFDGRARLLEVVLDQEPRSTTVEAKMHVGRGAPLVVHAKHETAEGAIDLVHDKVERAMRKKKERVRDMNRPKGRRVEGASAPPPAGAPPSEEE